MTEETRANEAKKDIVANAGSKGTKANVAIVESEDIADFKVTKDVVGFKAMWEWVHKAMSANQENQDSLETREKREHKV